MLASQEEQERLCEAVNLIDVTGDDSDDDEVVAVELTPSKAEALRLAAKDRAAQRALARQSADDARMAREIDEADRRSADEQLRADAQLARDLAAGADPRVVADEKVARALADELNGRSTEAPRPGDELNGRPAEALVPRPAAAGPAPPPLGDDRRWLRVVLPGGAKVDLRGLPRCGS